MCKSYEGKIRMLCKCTENIETEHQVYTESSNISDLNQATKYYYVCTECGNENNDKCND
jgi:hypothetical protein